MSFQGPNPLTLLGSVSPTVIVDPTLPPSNLIPAQTAFKVKVDWEVHGTAVPLLAGNFHVSAYFDGYGNGPEPVFGPVDVAVSSVPLVSSRRDYSTSISVPAGLPVGIYDLNVLITYTDAANAPGPLAGAPDQTVVLQVFPKP